MAHNPSPRLDSLLPSGSDSRLKVAHQPADAKPSLTDWVRALSAHGDKALSADLALDLVLHDIVERIMQATRASGAALALQKDMEFVCRATAGETAPGLGIRVNQQSGLSALCIKSKTYQICDDTRNDARIDANVSGELGACSVLVFPVMRNGLIGVIEIFSAEPNAFNERDAETLRHFSQEIADSIDQAEAVELNAVREKNDTELEGQISDLSYLSSAESPAPSRDTWTSLLTYAVVALALVLGILIGRVTWRAATSKSVSRDAIARRTTPAPRTSNSPSSVSTIPPQAAVDPHGDELIVYQNGKRVYPESPRNAKDTPKPVTSDTMRVSPEIAGEYIVERVEPEYPEQARNQGIQGPVVLNIVVGADGLVKNVSVASGNSQLALAASNAVQRWRFQPFLRSGQPQEFSTQVTIVFRLPSQT